MAGVQHVEAKDCAALELWLRGNVFALDNLGRGDEIQGLTVYVECPDPTARTSPLVMNLESRGAIFQWDVAITAQSIEIKKAKDADGGDVYEFSLKRLGKAGTIDVAGSTGGVYSSWERVMQEIAPLNLPSRLLNGAKTELDAKGFVTINMV
jgi:hypothetical protein